MLPLLAPFTRGLDSRDSHLPNITSPLPLGSFGVAITVQQDRGWTRKWLRSPGLSETGGRRCPLQSWTSCRQESRHIYCHCSTTSPTHTRLKLCRKILSEREIVHLGRLLKMLQSCFCFFHAQSWLKYGLQIVLLVQNMNAFDCKCQNKYLRIGRWQCYWFLLSKFECINTLKKNIFHIPTPQMWTCTWKSQRFNVWTK